MECPTEATGTPRESDLLYCDSDTQPWFCFVLLQGASVSKSTPLQKRGKVFKEPQSEASKIKKSLLVSCLNTIILIVCV